MTLNPKKFKVGQCVNFGGFMVSYDPKCETPDIKPENDKINRILNCQPPKSKAEVQSFVGLVKQLNSWSMKLSPMTDELRRLASNNTHFSWNESLEEELKKTQGRNWKAKKSATI